MRITYIALKELWHRKLGALVLLLGVTLSVGLIVAFQRVSQGGINELRKAMLEFGKNIVVLPAGVTFEQYWAGDLGDRTFPEEDVKSLAEFCIHSKPKLLARHFQGCLQREMIIQGKPLILCGITVEIDLNAPKAVTKGAQAPLAPDQAELGYRAAQALRLKKGDPLVLGQADRAHTCSVVRVRKETGTVDDYKVFVDLAQAQALLGTGKVVNVIEAVSCMCANQFLPKIAAKIEKHLFSVKDGKPRGKAYHFQAIVDARREARQSNLEHMNLLTIAAAVFGVVIVAGYSIWSARERRKEMGLMLAIAARPLDVAALVQLKMLLLGLLGGVLGCALGNAVVALYGGSGFNPNHPALRKYVLNVDAWTLYALAVAGALVLAVIPSLVGAVMVSRTDPAETLREL